MFLKLTYITGETILVNMDNVTEIVAGHHTKRTFLYFSETNFSEVSESLEEIEKMITGPVLPLLNFS